jgi:hypothetical protein|tara:strand:- start:5885 stop:6859 length:975 start_codon:yes stop_codon:yes gene_type:complete
VVIRTFPTVRDLNGGANYSTRDRQEPESKPLTPAENRIRAYEFTRQVESGSYKGKTRISTAGDDGKAIGDMQMWETYFIDAKNNPGRMKHGRPFHLKNYKDLTKAEHAGAETFAEYQRRWNEKGWIAGDLESIALTHNLGGPQYETLIKGTATQEVKALAKKYRKHLKSVEGGGRIPKAFFNTERWRTAAQGAKPMTQLTPNREKFFQQWYLSWSKIAGLAADPDDRLHYYDYRALFKEAMTGGRPPQPTFDKQKKAWKWPSKYKRKGHPAYYVWDKDQLIESPSGKPVLDYFSYKTLEAINPKKAKQHAVRLRDNNNIWSWKK